MAAARLRAPLVAGGIVALLLLAIAPPSPGGEERPGTLQAADDWPMYGGSAGHSFSNAATPPPKLGVIWTLTGNATLASAIGADGFVYVADVDTTPAPTGPNLVVHRLAEENGSFANEAGGWGARVVVPGSAALAPSRSLAVVGNRVYALFTVLKPTVVPENTTYQEILAILNAATGETAAVFDTAAPWLRPNATATLSAPVVGAGLVVFGAQDDNGTVYAVDASTGALSWSFPTGMPIETVPAIQETTVYVTSDSKLFFLDLAGCRNGDQGVVEPGCSPANGTRGDIVHVVDAGAVIRTSPVVGNPYVYLDVSGDVWAIDRTFGGAPVWSQTTAFDSEGTPAILGNVVVARRSDGRVYAYDRLTGDVLWVRGSLSAPPRGGDMAAADGRIFLSAQTGATFDLVVLDAADGSVLDRNTTALRPPLGGPIAMGTQVVVSEGSRLLAYRGQPDLEVLVQDVTMNLGPAQDGIARGNSSITVRNTGDEPAHGVRVRAYDGDEATGALIGEFVIGTADRPLRPGSRTSVFTADRDWSVGRHAVTVVVDRAPTETNAQNNRAVVFVYVQPGPSPPPNVLGAGPYWVALVLGFLVGLLILYVPIQRLREMRRKEREKPPPHKV